MAANPHAGILSIPSSHSVDQTVDKLTSILATKGITLFALVDHSGEARKAGMTMPPTKLLIFGSPRAGTPIMLAAPTARSIFPSSCSSTRTPTARSGSPGTALPISSSATAFHQI